MQIRLGRFLGIAVLLSLVAAAISFSQDDTQWVWGEVINIDTQNKVLTLKYLDYETDQEKEIAINTDENTTFDNLKSLDEIRPKDALSIDYLVTPDNKNIARNISLEKLQGDSVPLAQPDIDEITPDNL